MHILDLQEYRTYLESKELGDRTIKKYLLDIARFFDFANNGNLDIFTVHTYKERLMQKYKETTVNSYLISVNLYLKWINREDLCVRLIKCQHEYFSSAEFYTEEYHILLNYARQQKDKTWFLVMRCLGSTGMRVGELKFLTKESVFSGSVDICFKSKFRQVLLPTELRQMLLDYCDERKITSGIVFLNKKKTAPLDNSVIWRNIKKYAKKANLNEAKVYPHNFRHMFAQNYMNKYNNLFELADILGHSSLETTRIYTRISKGDQIKKLDRLNL